MKVCMTVLRMVMAIFVIIGPAPAHAEKPFMMKERKELALFGCLSMNYKKIGDDVFTHEWSSFHPRYIKLTERRSPEYDSKYIEFMDKHVSNFYKEQVSVKAEGRQPPFTVIFAKCMEFSESKALRDFIIKNPL